MFLGDPEVPQYKYEELLIISEKSSRYTSDVFCLFYDLMLVKSPEKEQFGSVLARGIVFSNA